MPSVTLYACSTGPNPPKVAYLLEELGIDYAVKSLQFGEGDDAKPGVKHPSFLAINPNGRVPAIVDHKNGDLCVWESGAILQYLAETYGPQYIGSGKEKWEVIEWLAFQISGHGPMQGQVNYFKHFFNKYWGEDCSPTIIKRFETETYRVYGVLENQLKKQQQLGSEYIVGKGFTIADMSFHGWLRTHAFAGLDLTNFPLLKAYIQRIEAKETVQRANKKIADASA